MAARSGLTEILKYLRQYGNAARDEVFSGVIYWVDPQLEDIAETWAVRQRVRLNPATSDWLTFSIDLPRHYMVDTDSLVIYTDAGAEVETTYSIQVLRGEVVFTSALAEGYYYVEGLFVHMWSALADLWEQKASQRTGYINFKAGQKSMFLEQEYNHCVARGAYYRRKVMRRHNKKWRT